MSANNKKDVEMIDTTSAAKDGTKTEDIKTAEVADPFFGKYKYLCMGSNFIWFRVQEEYGITWESSER